MARTTRMENDSQRWHQLEARRLTASCSSFPHAPPCLSCPSTTPLSIDAPPVPSRPSPVGATRGLDPTAIAAFPSFHTSSDSLCVQDLNLQEPGRTKGITMNTAMLGACKPEMSWFLKEYMPEQMV
ncbi:hypothetical protein ABZP36_017387 [Zizania latifolia]